VEGRDAVLEGKEEGVREEEGEKEEEKRGGGGDEEEEKEGDSFLLLEPSMTLDCSGQVDLQVARTGRCCS
jgi:hypothetical protein